MRGRRAALAWLALTAAAAANGTLTGKFVTPLGGAVANGTLVLALSQAGVAPGSYAVVPSPASCYTSTDGSVVGLPNPTALPAGSTSTATGSLPQGVYFVELSYYAPGVETLASPEAQFTLAAAGKLTINAPTLRPAGASGINVYIGTSPGAETKQGSAAPGAAYVQSAALASGASLPGANTSACSFTFNDAIIPAYTYYTATLSDASGNALAGFPQAWYLSGTTQDVSNLAPLSSNPAVRFPMPVVANPATTAAQSVGSALQLNGYNVQGTGNLGPGFVSGFYAGNLPTTTTTLAAWTPNAAVTARRLDVNAQTAGSGGSGGASFALTNGASTCSFSGAIPATATSTSLTPTGTCNFAAGVAITLALTSDDHSVAPQNINWSIEVTGWQ